MNLSADDRKLYKKLLARGELSEVQDRFGEGVFSDALTYIARQSAHWRKQLSQGFLSKQVESTLPPVVVQIPLSQADSNQDPVQIGKCGRKRRVVATSLSSDENKKQRKGDQRSTQTNSDRSGTTETSSSSNRQSTSSRSPHSKRHPGKQVKNAKDVSKKLHGPSKPLNPSIRPTFQNPIPLLPRKHVPFRQTYAEIRLGQMVRLLIPAYSTFIQRHASLFNDHQQATAHAVIEQFMAIPLTVVEGKVTGMEMLPSVHPDCMMYSLQCLDGQILSVLSLLPYSPILQTAPHLVDETVFQQSMTWLHALHHKFNGILTEDRTLVLSKDTKITMIFALPETVVLSPSDVNVNVNVNVNVMTTKTTKTTKTSGNNQTTPSTTMGELYEGVIYDVTEDALENPYQSIRVVWLGVSAITHAWVMDFYQTDNHVSPWELVPSQRAECTPEIEQIPRAYCGSDTLAILNLLRDPKIGPDGNSLFENLAELFATPAYQRQIHHPVDFQTVERKLQEGAYRGEQQSLFWDDLQCMVENTKRFNQTERVEWRIADILECTIHRLKRDIQLQRIRFTQEDAL